MEGSLAAACTKARANWGKLIKKEQYDKLLDARNSSEALKFLKENTKYKNILNYNEFNDAALINTEEELMRFYINEIYNFNYYLHDNYKLLINVIFIRCQIEDIKNMIRYKNLKYNDKNEIKFMTEKCPINKLSFERLLNSESLGEIAQMLKGTIYYKSIYELLNDKSKTAYFNFEKQLDYEYIKEAKSFSEGLRGESANIVGHLIGEYEDLLILKSIFRIKKYFNNEKINIDGQEDFGWSKIKKADIKILNAARDSNDFLKLSEKYKFNDIYIKSIKNNSSIEKEIDIYMKKLYTAQKKKNSNTIAVIIAYFELLMYEIKNIIMILEGKKYKLSADIAGKYII